MSKKCAVFLSAAVAAATGLAPALAQAQSAVTLYGNIDVGVGYVSNIGGSHAYQEMSGSELNNRWGLLGKEDLGGGLKAIFQLENGFNSTNGTLANGGREFGRQAYVGLSDNRFGTLTLGRQYSAMVDALTPLIAGARGLTTFAFHPYDNDNLNSFIRLNNAVKYRSATYYGITAEALYAFSNAAGGFDNNRASSASLAYQAGPLNLAAGYLMINHPGSSNASGASTDTMAADLYRNGVVNVSKITTWGMGGTYKFGALTTGLMYTNARDDLINGAPLKWQNIEGSVSYNFTPSWQATAAETFSNVKNLASAPSTHFWQSSLGMRYFLSKSTDVYVDANVQVASSNGKASIVATSGASSTRTQVVAVAGIRHSF
jgi:predicted porin